MARRFVCMYILHIYLQTHSYVGHVSFVCVTWLIRTGDMTHLFVWHDSFICIPCLIHVLVMTDSYACNDSFIIEATWLIHMCDITRSCVCRGWHAAMSPHNSISSNYEFLQVMKVIKLWIFLQVTMSPHNSISSSLQVMKKYCSRSYE